LVAGDPSGVPVRGFLQIVIFLKRSAKANFDSKRMGNQQHLKTISLISFLHFWPVPCSPK